MITSSAGFVPHLDVELGGDNVTFDYGRCYIICEKRIDKATKIVQDFFYSGSCTLCITRMHPGVLNEKIPDTCHTSKWLSEQSGPNNIGPRQLNKIVDCIREFLAGKKNAVILLDGIEYLALFNSFEKIQMFYETVYDQVMASGAILIIPLDPQSLDQRSLARLRRYSEIVQ
jgi:archaellum biogenesis ATPase FlaH